MELKYRPEIDGLRTIAVISVIIYHAEFMFESEHLLKGGFLGVDIFFVISGFLITSVIMREYQRTGYFSIANFYDRRIRRLLPALLTVMLVALPFAWVILYPSQLVDFSKSLIASLLFGSNFYWNEVLSEYGTESALLKPFLHTWSLAVEEQYYIIFPLLLIAILRWYKRHTILILSAAFIISLIFAQWATSSGYSSFSFYMLPSRFWELIAGALLANFLFSYPRKDQSSLFYKIMPIVGLCLIFYSVIFIEFGEMHPGFITLIPVSGTIFIIWFSNENDHISKFLSSKLMVGIGLISYSLYLWHYPIFALARVHNYDETLYDKLIWIFFTVVLSIATYFLIEKPFRKRNVTSRKVLYSSILLVIAIITAYSFYAIKNDGLKERFSKLMEIYEKNEFDNKILRRSSWDILERLAQVKGMDRSTGIIPSDFEIEHLWFGDNPDNNKILIIGDSHGKDLFNALYLNKELFPNKEFARFGMNTALYPDQINKLFGSPNFATAGIVIISFRYNEETVDRISELITNIKNKSKQVILVLSITEFDDINGKAVYDGYAESHFDNFSTDELKRTFFDSRNHDKDEINKSLKIIAGHHNILALDKTDFVCDLQAKTCDGITDDAYKAFYDFAHFTLEGARHFGRRIHETNWLRID